MLIQFSLSPSRQNKKVQKIWGRDVCGQTSRSQSKQKRKKPLFLAYRMPPRRISTWGRKWNDAKFNLFGSCFCFVFVWQKEKADWKTVLYDGLQKPFIKSSIKHEIRGKILNYGPVSIQRDPPPSPLQISLSKEVWEDTEKSSSKAFNHLFRSLEMGVGKRALPYLIH